MSDDEPPEDKDSSDFKKIRVENSAVHLDAEQDDRRAQKEADQLGRGQSIDRLRKEAEKSEHGRNEDFKKHFGWITVAALYILALAVFLFGFTWFWHTLTPGSWHWLPEEQLVKIQNMFTGGVLAGVIADQFRKKMH